MNCMPADIDIETSFLTRSPADQHPITEEAHARTDRTMTSATSKRAVLRRLNHLMRDQVQASVRLSARLVVVQFGVAVIRQLQSDSTWSQTLSPEVNPKSRTTAFIM